MIGIVLSLLGIGGIGGLVALFVFAPATAAIVVPAAARAGQAVLATRAGCAAIALGVGLAAGAVYAEQACDARITARDAEWIERERLAAERYNALRAERDEIVRKETRASVDGQLRALDATIAGLKTKVSDYEKSRPRAAAACRASPDLVRARNRLLDKK